MQNKSEIVPGLLAIKVSSSKEGEKKELVFSSVESLSLLESFHVSKESGQALLRKAKENLGSQSKVAKQIGVGASQISKLMSDNSPEYRIKISDNYLPLFRHLSKNGDIAFEVDESLSELSQERINETEQAISNTRSSENRQAQLQNVILVACMVGIFSMIFYDGYKFSFEYNGLKNPFGIFDPQQKARYEEMKAFCGSLPDDQCKLNREYFGW
jgi:transcriptional regulator with XRE-family HTH domain